jgi:hypothetical protein
MSTNRIFTVEGEVADWGKEIWLVCAESEEDAKVVWSDPENGGQTEEDGFKFIGAKEIPGEELLDFGGGDDGWEGLLPEGGEVVSHYEPGSGLEGQPNEVKATATAWAAFFGRMTLTDPLA